MTSKVVQANKLDNGYWQIVVLDNINQTVRTITNTSFYRVNNKDIKLKNYIYADPDNSYVYFDKSYSPKFIAQLIYLYLTFAKENSIPDNDVLQIDKQLNFQGLTLSKYGISKININTIYPCIDIDPYPKSLQFQCLNDKGVIVSNDEIQAKVPYLKNIAEFGQTKVVLSLWNFSYVVCGGVLVFLVIFLFVMRTEKS